LSRWLRTLLLTLAIALPAIGILPELLLLPREVNDNAFHIGVVQSLLDALHQGGNPLDCWFPTWLAGFPLLHYYQPAPYLLLALLWGLGCGKLALPFLLKFTLWAALTLIPVSMYRALRWLSCTPLTAAWGALLSVVIADGGKYGLAYESFTWIGWGLYAQALAAPLVPLALAGGYRVIVERERPLRGALLIALTSLTHILYGYIAGLSLFLPVLMSRERAEWPVRLRQMVLLFALVGALTAFFVAPLVLHGAYHYESLYDEAGKFNSYGAPTILSWLFTGELFDHNRLPLYTVLVLGGLGIGLWRWHRVRENASGWMALAFLCWLAFYFGRPTWGALIDLLPMTSGLHIERLVNGVHLFGCMLGALAAGVLTQWIFERRTVWRQGIGLLLLLGGIAALLGPRIAYLASNVHFMREAVTAYHHEYPDFVPILAYLHEHPQARVYAGYNGNWGTNYHVGQVPVYLLLTAEGIPTIANAPFSWAMATDAQLQFPEVTADFCALYDIQYLLTNNPAHAPRSAQLLMHSGPHYLFTLPSPGRASCITVPYTIIGTKDTAAYAELLWARSNWSAAGAHFQLNYTRQPNMGRHTLRAIDALHYEENVHTTDAPAGTPMNWFAESRFFAETPPGHTVGTCQVTALTGQALTVRVTTPASTVVMCRMTNHPWWKATLDGRPAPTFMVSPGFLAVQVPAGRHELQIRYQAETKLWLLLAGLLLVGGYAFFSCRRSGTPVTNVQWAWMDDRRCRYGLLIVVGVIILLVVADKMRVARKLPVPLSTRTHLEATQGWGTLHRNRTVEDRRLCVGGLVFRLGLGTHAVSHLTYRLDGKYRSFETFYGADDEAAQWHRLQFRILVDGKVCADSGIVAGYHQPGYASVDVTNARNLTLEVLDGGDGITADHADWIYPALMR